MPVLLAWLIAFGLELPARADTPIGRFNGVFQCYERGFHVSVNLSQSDHGKLSGDLLVTDQLVPARKRRSKKPVQIKGMVEPTGTLVFDTRERFYLNPRVHEPLKIRVVRNPSNGYLVGDVVREGCGIFVVAPDGTREEAVNAFIQRTIIPARARARIDAEYEARIRSGYVPIELRPSGGILLLQPYLKYVDRAAGRTEQERRNLLKTVWEELEHQGLICAMGSNVVWKGDTGMAGAFGFSATRYLIACLINCEGLRYFAGGAQGQQSHFGLLYSFPVAALNLAQTGPLRVPFHDFEWQFKKTVPTAPDARIIVTTWQPLLFGVLSDRGTCQRALDRSR